MFFHSVYWFLWLIILLFSCCIWKLLFSQKLCGYISRCKGMIYLDSGKDPNELFYSKLARYLSVLFKIPFFFVRIAAWFYCHCHKLCFFQCVESCKILFHDLGSCALLICLTLSTTIPTSSSKHKITETIQNIHKFEHRTLTFLCNFYKTSN